MFGAQEADVVVDDVDHAAAQFEAVLLGLHTQKFDDQVVFLELGIGFDAQLFSAFTQFFKSFAVKLCHVHHISADRALLRRRAAFVVAGLFTLRRQGHAIDGDFNVFIVAASVAKDDALAHILLVDRFVCFRPFGGSASARARAAVVALASCRSAAAIARIAWSISTPFVHSKSYFV